MSYLYSQQKRLSGFEIDDRSEVATSMVHNLLGLEKVLAFDKVNIIETGRTIHSHFELEAMH